MGYYYLSFERCGDQVIAPKLTLQHMLTAVYTFEHGADRALHFFFSPRFGDDYSLVAAFPMNLDNNVPKWMENLKTICKIGADIVGTYCSYVFPRMPQTEAQIDLFCIGVAIGVTILDEGFTLSAIGSISAACKEALTAVILSSRIFCNAILISRVLTAKNPIDLACESLSSFEPAGVKSIEIELRDTYGTNLLKYDRDIKPDQSSNKLYHTVIDTDVKPYINKVQAVVKCGNKRDCGNGNCAPVGTCCADEHYCDGLCRPASECCDDGQICPSIAPPPVYSGLPCQSTVGPCVSTAAGFQAALDASHSRNDVVVICGSSTIITNFTINVLNEYRDMTICCEAPPCTVQSDGNDLTLLARAFHGSLTLQDLSFVGGNKGNIVIILWGSNGLLITGCEFKNGFGGGAGNLNVDGLYFDGSITVLGSTFADGKGLNGGGMAAMIDPGTSFIIRNSAFYRNSATVDGGGLFANTRSPSNTVIEGATFSGNTALRFGGGFCFETESPTNIQQMILSSKFCSNSGEAGGAGIFISRYNLANVTSAHNSGNGNLALKCEDFALAECA
jgi:hypothetical protein